MKRKLFNKMVALILMVLCITTILPNGIKANAYIIPGWNNEEGSWYYYENGAKKIGWYYLNESWYFFGNDGSMKTGWLNYGGKWYYLQSDGSMKVGWVSSNGYWYYLNSDGTMRTGWIDDNGKWRYLSNSGEMVRNTTINGYKLDENGVLIQQAEVNKDVDNYNDIVNAKNLIKKADLSYINSTKNDYELVYDKAGNETSKKFGINEDTYAFAFQNGEQVDKYYFVGKTSGNVYKSGSNGLFAAYLLKDGKLVQRFKGPYYLEKSEANYIKMLGNEELKQK